MIPPAVDIGVYVHQEPCSLRLLGGARAKQRNCKRLEAGLEVRNEVAPEPKHGRLAMILSFWISLCLNVLIYVTYTQTVEQARRRHEMGD